MHKDILLPSDEEWIHKLGTLVQLSIALDSTEIGIVSGLKSRLHNHTLDLSFRADKCLSAWRTLRMHSKPSGMLGR